MANIHSLRIVTADNMLTHFHLFSVDVYHSMILSNAAHEEIITWLPHGRSWRIVQQKEFENKVIPLYFRHGQYSSFCRQVSGWGFKRITNGKDYNSYYHPLFLRGLPYLCDHMRRLAAKDHVAQKRRQAAQQDLPPPDLEAFTAKFPLPEGVPVDEQPSTGALLTVPPAFSGHSMPPNTADSEAVALNKELQAIEERRNHLLARIQNKPSSNSPDSTSLNALQLGVGASSAMQTPGPRASSQQLESLLNSMHGSDGKINQVIQGVHQLAGTVPGGMEGLLDLLRVLAPNQNTNATQHPRPSPQQQPPALFSQQDLLLANLMSQQQQQQRLVATPQVITSMQQSPPQLSRTDSSTQPRLNSLLASILSSNGVGNSGGMM